jgi:hypothetical protein
MTSCSENIHNPKRRQTLAINSKAEGPIEPGYWVALTLKPNVAPLRCYVGVVQAMDERGLRITLIDWMVGTASGFDMYAPWENITAALVATPVHSIDLFGDDASLWQKMSKELPA